MRRRVAAAGWYRHGCSANLLEGGESLTAVAGARKGFLARGFLAGIVPVNQPGCRWRTKEGWGESAGGMLVTPGGEGGDRSSLGREGSGSSSHPSSAGELLWWQGVSLSLGRHLVDRRVSWETSMWALGRANCADDIPAVRMIFPLSCP